MYEYIRFKIGGYFTGDRSIDIRANGRHYDVSKTVRRRGSEKTECFKCADVSLDDWTRQFMGLHVEKWKKRYYEPIKEGTSWALEYKLRGREAVAIEGSNGYPENWHDFKLVMKDLEKLFR